MMNFVPRVKLLWRNWARLGKSAVASNYLRFEDANAYSNDDFIGTLPSWYLAVIVAGWFLAIGRLNKSLTKLESEEGSVDAESSEATTSTQVPVAAK